ncbi:MAG TPA: cation transporting ATPase C-terminal domain-containing protein, partial [Candidatus Udaeobacter sp.]|nr:cation transporting ATPase C-terminal domain-containing protein [Candidatus Udaeobacter sp.]
VSTVFDLITFAVLLLVLHAGLAEFRTGWFVESLATQILMIFAVRSRRNLFASRPHMLVALLALSTTVLTLALPFLPPGRWFEFVALGWPFWLYLALVVAAFLAAVEAVKRAFYAKLVDKS